MTADAKSLSFFVEGLPGAQGSKRHVGNGVMVEQNAKVEPWRQDVRAAAKEAAGGVCFVGPTAVTVSFVMPHVKSDRYRWLHTTRGDLDKLVRSTLDALESCGVLANDALVCSLTAHKRHARPTEPAGASIRLEDLSESEALVRESLKTGAKASS